jgi:hypothetical protein
MQKKKKKEKERREDERKKCEKKKKKKQRSWSGAGGEGRMRTAGRQVMGLVVQILDATDPSRLDDESTDSD